MILDRERFLAAVEKSCNRLKGEKGIGTLGEKSVHAALKAYFEPQSDNTEIRIGSFVADIAGEDGIIEIQTRQFYRLVKKLDCFLEYTHVTVVYPIIAKKYVRWLDPETGELSARRVSPRKGSIYDACKELVSIKFALDNPRFTFVAVMLEAEDIRLLDGYGKDKKKHSTKFDRVPIDILCEYRFECPRDYMMLIPPELSGRFTSKDLAKAAGISRTLAGIALNILTYTECVSRVGKNGREIIYEINDPKG